MFARCFVEDDLATLKALHEAWYPLRYATSFYNTLVDGRAEVWTSIIVSPSAPDPPPIDAALAAAAAAAAAAKEEEGEGLVETGGVEGDCVEAAGVEGGGVEGGGGGVEDDPPDRRSCERDRRPMPRLRSIVAPTVAQKEGRDALEAWAPRVFDGHVAAAISARLMHMSACEDAYVLRDILGPEATVFYIQTLGTCTGFRRQKLASHLVWRCIEKAVECRECDAVYLHVISYNVVRTPPPPPPL